MQRNKTILRDTNGKRYYKNVLYPNIPLNVNDIYVLTSIQDRVDQLAYQYYKDETLWWVIMEANTDVLERDSFFTGAGKQIRIPADTNKVIQDFNRLNNF